MTPTLYILLGAGITLLITALLTAVLILIVEMRSAPIYDDNYPW